MAEVTIIIPLYNKERQIERAIRSVQQQTFGDWHLIVVNDGSTDSGPQVVNSIQDCRIKLIHQDNTGPGAARNVGIRLAKTPYISFLDADDEWHPEFLETTLKAISENDVAMVSTSIVELPGGYDYLDKLKVHKLQPGIFHFCGNENPDDVESIISLITAKSSLLHTEIATKYGGFYEKNRCLFGEDRAFLWRVAFGERFMVIGRALAYYYTDDSELGSHTRSRPLPPYLEDPDVFLDYCPQSMHTLIREVLDIQVLRQIQNQFRYGFRTKLLWLLLRHPGTKRYPILYRKCFKRLMPGFLIWQRIKNKLRSKNKSLG
ncbi:MAG: glycosyltransferase family 2 protein [Planctomycetota bacterium]|jgi:glycosyltransferase involved in cell wall biosynthesis